jgi:long-chain acyl-CoA synthetase
VARATVGNQDGVFVSPFATDPRLSQLTGPGGPFEVERIEVDGVPVRSLVRVPATVLEAFRATETHGEATHLVLADCRLTFADVRRQALLLAGGMRDGYGVRPGDRVAIAMRNLPEFVVAFWGTALLGAIAVPLNAWWTGPELHYALRDCGAKLVFADPERIARLASAPDSVPTSAPVVGVRAPAGTAGMSATLADLLAAARPLDVADIAAPDPGDPVTLLYTSGTTGRPKGALNTHRGTMTSILNMGFAALRDQVISGPRAGSPAQPAGAQPAGAQPAGAQPAGAQPAGAQPAGAQPAGSPGQPTTVVAGPLFHIGGIASIVGGALGGTKLVFLHKWDTGTALELAEREGATSLGGVPAVARQILGHPALSRVAPRLRSFSMGGAAVAPDLVRQAREVFGDSVQLVNGYGLTETTSAVVSNVGAEYAGHPDSVGRLNLTAELRVEGPDGQALGVGEIGELCFRSPQLAKGYWNDPEATRAAFVDGWFHSGDLGYLDAEGFVYVVDRLKDVVIRGGENVYCAEVEAVLGEHPWVAEVAVVGLPDQALGERVCAVVVSRPGARVDLAELREFADGRLAAFKRPEALHVVAELPRTATGKVAKHRLRAELRGPHPS